MKKILLYSLAAMVGIVAVLLVYVQFTWRVDHTAEFPLKEIEIKPDSAMLANGKYLVYGPAHCSTCHVPISQVARIDAGEELPLIGGFEFTLPFGKLYSSNITTDPVTGIGSMSDAELYRMMRYNVKHDGMVTLELMPFKDMSDYDIRSVIAYLRTTAPVANEVPANEFNLLGKALMKFAIKPSVPSSDIPTAVKPDSSILYGKYLAASVANCRGCHTARDMSTGAFTGPEYAGGMEFLPTPETGGWHFVTPNLTDEEAVPSMATEQDFINRFRAGRVIASSPMPWGSFGKMSDSDLKAIYRYLKTIEKHNNPEAGKIIPPQANSRM